jgi:hypothetical protein
MYHTVWYIFLWGNMLYITMSGIYFIGEYAIYHAIWHVFREGNMLYITLLNENDAIFSRAPINKLLFNFMRNK